jgi:hypothetical protein
LDVVDAADYALLVLGPVPLQQDHEQQQGQQQQQSWCRVLFCNKAAADVLCCGAVIQGLTADPSPAKVILPAQVVSALQQQLCQEGQQQQQQQATQAAQATSSGLSSVLGSCTALNDVSWQLQSDVIDKQQQQQQEGPGHELLVIKQLFVWPVYAPNGECLTKTVITRPCMIFLCFKCLIRKHQLALPLLEEALPVAHLVLLSMHDVLPHKRVVLPHKRVVLRVA